MSVVMKKLLNTIGLFAVLQIEEQLLHLAKFGRVNQLTFLHDLPGQRGRVCVGVEAFQANAEGETYIHVTITAFQRTTEHLVLRCEVYN